MASEPTRSSVPSERRIFSLVLALVASAQGVTKHTLLSSVYGYAERYRPGEPNPTLERQFERDKEHLRALGIPIDTLDSPDEAGNNQLTRYRIAKEQLEFPAGLTFDEDELMLLRLAALAWREGSLSAESRRAVMRLESLGAGLDVQYLGVAPKLGSAEPAAGALQQAIDAGVPVQFNYSVPDRDAPLARRVAPLRLHRLDGRWHLISWDLERDAPRVFLLARIEGAVKRERRPYDEALRSRADEIIAKLIERQSDQQAIISVQPATAAEAGLAPRAVASSASDGLRTLTIGMLDEHVLSDELVGYGADAQVRAPASLRALVTQKLQAISHAHKTHQRTGEARHG